MLSTDVSQFTINSVLDVFFTSKSLEELCQQLVHRHHATGFRSVSFHIIDFNSDLVKQGSYGDIPSEFESQISVWATTPYCQAIREKLATSGRLESDGKSWNYTVIPLVQNHAPIGASFFLSEPDSNEITIDEDVAEVISRVGAFYLKNMARLTSNPKSNHPPPNPEELTGRQVQILGLMADGLTNAEIASIVLLSESTVRQETIKIYRCFGVAGRKEAVIEARKLKIVPRIMSTGT